MAPPYPYTYYSCPCRDFEGTTSRPQPAPSTLQSTSARSNKDRDPEQGADGARDDDEDDEQTFNPQSSRANYSLYPLEYLLFCNECHEIRCPRCYYEEALYYYCPGCLLETSSASVKSETNSAFQPSPSSSDPSQQLSFQPQQPHPSSQNGPFILTCPYCSWSTLSIGITLPRSINVSAQLSRILNGGQILPSNATGASTDGPSDRQRSASGLGLSDMLPRTGSSLQRESSFSGNNDDKGNGTRLKQQHQHQHQQEQFTALANFYRGQLLENEGAEAGGADGRASLNALDSPGALTRILSTYGVGGLKKQRGKPQVMREAKDENEGLVVSEPVWLDQEEEDENKNDLVAGGGEDGKEISDQEKQKEREQRHTDDRASIDAQIIHRMATAGFENIISKDQLASQKIIPTPADPGRTSIEQQLLARQRHLQHQSDGADAQHSPSDQPPISDDPLNPHFPTNLRPIPYPLRSKRAKRCRSCRHNLLRPEEKRHSTRFKIRLLACNYIPRLSVKPFTPPTQQQQQPSQPQTAQQQQQDLKTLPPLKTSQYLLTLTNPLFDPVHITLATPPICPSGTRKTAAKVTILCPEFDVGASTDVWDEALDSSNNNNPSSVSTGGTSGQSDNAGFNRGLEAGKPHSRGRNWTTIAVEIVPGVSPPAPPPSVAPAPAPSSSTFPAATATATETAAANARPSSILAPTAADFLSASSAAAERGELDIEAETEDERNAGSSVSRFNNEEEEQEGLPGKEANPSRLEIPIFVRMGYETDESAGDPYVGSTGAGGVGSVRGRGGGRGEEKKVRRELAFWVVLGVGEVAT
ncbi:MAG: hypothetical protein M1831_000173 [Alyxoria varia]|nr:MAG: hypothetical protein M1831_000173 [Alyxoria varia]